MTTDQYVEQGDTPDNDTVEPFGASVAGVKALVPEARLLTAPPTPGVYGITETQVLAWLGEISDVVAMRLDGWQRLPGRDPEDVNAPEVTPDRDQLKGYARTVIHNGAASYLEAARFPERSSKNPDRAYSAILWERFEEGLERLAVWLDGKLVNADDPGTGVGGLAYSFPPAAFPDAIRF